MNLIFGEQKYDYDENSNLTSRGRKLHWFLVFLYVLAYCTFYYIIINVTSNNPNRKIIIEGGLTRVGLVGILAQSQSLVILLMILNPIKQGKTIAIGLSMVTGFGAFCSVILNHNMNAVAGIIAPITTVIFVLAVTRFSKSLNEQIRKVTEYNRIIKENEVVLHQMAYYDSLTGLPNRAMMFKEMEEMTRIASKEKRTFCFVYLDLDNFKKINDVMGHTVGDEIIKQVALRLQSCVHEKDLLGRIGGDEFALLIRRYLTEESLIKYMEQLKNTIAEPFVWDKKELYISVSFGVTSFPKDGKDVTELMKNADIALYRAKYNGKNAYQFFNSDLMGEVLTQIKLDNGLRKAVKNQELFVVYQPIYHSSTKKIRGYEALLRWQHAELGMVNPMQFIPIAENNGAIIEIGQWVIRHVLHRYMELHGHQTVKPVISINISVVQMLEPSFVTMVSDIIHETGFDPRYLEMEITESVLISSPEKIIQVIRQLKDMGIRIALDDFGSGYASLSSLQLLKPQVLKIDKSLIDEITSENPISHIVGSIISLAHQLDINVVAEGVETELQMEYLRKKRCDYIQGYLFSKPLKEEEIMKRKRRLTDNEGKQVYLQVAK